MDVVPKTAWASAKMNNDFILIDTLSGYRICTLDPQADQIFLDTDVDNNVLGHALLDALGRSRFISPILNPEEDRLLFDHKATHSVYEKWIKNLMCKYSYKTSQMLFKDMRCCNVICTSGTIEIIPTNHIELEAWSGRGIDKSDRVKISINTGIVKIGEALRSTFNRCIA